MKLTICITIILTFIITSLGLTTIPVTGIKLKVTDIKLQAGKTYTLVVSITPFNATNKKVTFTTANKNIATVDRYGKIKAITAGKTIITVRSISNKKAIAKCNVLVSKSKLFEKPVTITFMLPSNAQSPYQENWYLWKMFEDKTGAKLKVEAIGDTAYAEKVNLAIASGNLPDMLFQNNTNIVNQYGPEGAFVRVFDQLSKQPNFFKWYKQNEDYAFGFLAGDGNLYTYPNQGIGETNRRGWLYRKDIFQKENIALPNNEIELYNILKLLKQKYPNSYPLLLSYGLSYFGFMSVAWGTEHTMYLDNAKNEWRYGPTEDNYKEMVTFYAKLYKEKLIPQDFTTLDLSGAETLLANDQAFIYPTYFHLDDTINANLKPSKPGFEIKNMPVFKCGPNGVAKKNDWTLYFGNIAVSSKSKNVENTLQFMDWLYTDEAYDLVSWGEEGKTYKIVNGKREFILKGPKDIVTLRKEYGISTFGSYLRFNFDSHLSLMPENSERNIEEDKKYDLPLNPGWQIKFVSPEKEINTTIGADISQHMSTNILKFIMGVRDLKEWDLYVKEIKDKGLDKLKAIYKTTYERMKKYK